MGLITGPVKSETLRIANGSPPLRRGSLSSSAYKRYVAKMTLPLVSRFGVILQIRKICFFFCYGGHERANNEACPNFKDFRPAFLGSSF